MVVYAPSLALKQGWNSRHSILTKNYENFFPVTGIDVIVAAAVLFVVCVIYSSIVSEIALHPVDFSPHIPFN